MEKDVKNDIQEEVKHYVFVKEGYRHYDPQHLTVGSTTVQLIFPVPESNAVGALDEESNGIVFIKFGEHGAAPECKAVAQNFSETAYGPFVYRFSPNFSEDTIVYSKIRAAVIANVKTGEAFHARCGLSVDDYVLGIRFLDPQENIFVVVKSIDEGKNGWKNYLHVMKLEEQQLVDTAWAMYIGQTRHISQDFPLHHIWLVHNKNLFVYDQKWNKILYTDGKLSMPHPFSETFNANTGRIGSVKDFVIHPKLPFGVIIEESASKTHDLVVLRWDLTNPKEKDEQVISFSQDLEQLKSLFGLTHMALAYQSFSPDGSWYVVGCIAPDAPQSPHFIAIPVTPADEEHPYFLDMDNLVVLGQVAGMTSIAWTSEPTSYVVSNGELLHKWDLDELPNARVFVMPEDNEDKKASIFRKIGRLFGLGKA